MRDQNCQVHAEVRATLPEHARINSELSANRKLNKRNFLQFSQAQLSPNSAGALRKTETRRNKFRQIIWNLVEPYEIQQANLP